MIRMVIRKVFASYHVAQAAKHQRPKRPHDEAGGKSQQRENEGRARIKPAKELLGNDRGKRSVQIEVVPLENGAERGSEDHFPLFGAHRPRGGMLGCHELSPPGF